MGFCNTCLIYSESLDRLGRDFNDIGNEKDHFCPMYQDKMPDGVYDGEAVCKYYIPKDGEKE